MLANVARKSLEQIFCQFNPQLEPQDEVCMSVGCECVGCECVVCVSGVVCVWVVCVWVV